MFYIKWRKTQSNKQFMSKNAVHVKRYSCIVIKWWDERNYLTFKCVKAWESKIRWKCLIAVTPAAYICMASDKFGGFETILRLGLHGDVWFFVIVRVFIRRKREIFHLFTTRIVYTLQCSWFTFYGKNTNKSIRLLCIADTHLFFLKKFLQAIIINDDKWVSQ